MVIFKRSATMPSMVTPMPEVTVSTVKHTGFSMYTSDEVCTHLKLRGNSASIAFCRAVQMHAACESRCLRSCTLISVSQLTGIVCRASPLRVPQVKRISVKRLTNPVTLDMLGNALPDGLYDAALGPMSSTGARCVTCGMPPARCAGHFGHIELPVPVFSPLVIKCAPAQRAPVVDMLRAQRAVPCMC